MTKEEIKVLESHVEILMEDQEQRKIGKALNHLIELYKALEDSDGCNIV